MTDINFMKMALQLAEKGYGWVSPNPVVGAIIVKDGEVIGQGWHEKYGGLHAERNALAACTESPEGATMYVTLEPCCHHGKQPPCVDAIIEAGISRVVVGASDPNPLVAGKGIRILKEHGIAVTEGVCREECEQMNEVFFHYIRTGSPYVVMKYAMTLDGKIATYTGESKWITGECARYHVQKQRHRYSAIMVGVGTVLADDPMLNCRMEGGKNPIRIICDTSLRTPLTAQVVTTADSIETILVTCCKDKKKHRPYQEAGCRILVVGKRKGHVDLQELMERLGKDGIDSILLEGGGTLNWTALESGMIHKVKAYIAPKLFGGSTARTPIEGQGILTPREAVLLKNIKIHQIGEDIMIEGEVNDDVYRNC